jgi:hypothetical protein
MTETLTGGCQCGALRYEIAAEPLAFYVCHCTECRRQSASAFGLSILFRQDALRITLGALKEWRRPTASGGALACRFCPDCGTRICHEAPGEGIVSLKSGTLDDPGRFAPAAHIWTRSALPWVTIPAHTANFAGEPDDDAAPMDAFERRPNYDQD